MKLCSGISIKNSKPCRNYVSYGNFCHYHQDQVNGKNKFNVPIIQVNENKSNYKQTQYNYCKFITNGGNTCKNRVTYNDICHLHQKLLSEDYLKENLKTQIIFQCKGLTKRGERCKNKYKEPNLFCHKHNKIRKEIDKELFISGRSLLNFLMTSEWIKPDLLQETKELIRNEIMKPISESDESGYIYVYRLPEENNSQHTLYKIGRSINVWNRLYQWNKKCKYSPELIEMFPNIKTSSFSKYEIEVDSDKSKVKYVHRAERLIHLELKARFKADNEKCKNCGSIHQELFKINNLDSNKKKNEMYGWDKIRKIIIHWILYIEKVYGTN